MKWFLRGSMLTLVLILSLVGCRNAFQVGLGEETDLGVPRVNLTSPDTGSFLTGTVTLRGTAEDDQEVVSVEVSFDRGSTWKSVDSFDPESGEWSYEFDSTTRPDGRLFVTVRSTDNADRTTTTDDSVYNIDNSPPVVLVSEPRSYESLTFNTDAVITVNAADVHAIRKFGSVVERSLDGGATWEEVETSEVAQSTTWTKVFESGEYTSGLEPPEAHFRFYLWAEDEAGNRSSSFYHIDDLNADDGPWTADTLLDELEGRGSLNEEDIRAVRMPGNGEFTLFFDENADVPTIDWISPVSAEPGGIPGTRSEGLLAGIFRDDDGIQIDEDDDGIQIDEDVTEIPTPVIEIRRAPDFSLDDYEADPEGVTWDDTVWPDEHEVESASPDLVSSDITSVSWEYRLGPDLGQGYYRARLWVNDIDGTASERYARVFVINDGSPSIEIDSPDNIYFNNNFVLEGRASAPADGELEGVSVDIHDGASSDTGWALDGGNASYTSETQSWTYDTDADDVDLPGLNGGSDLSALADGNILVRAAAYIGDSSDARQITMVKDTVPPDVGIDSPSAGSSLNRTAEIQGFSSDDLSGIDTVEVRVDGSGDDMLADWTAFSTAPATDGYEFSGVSTNWTLRVDTELFDDETPLTVFVRAHDRAGNTTETSRLYTVSQESDLPTVAYSNMDVDGDELDNVLSGDPRLIGSVSDDDAVDPDSFRYRVWRASDSSWTDWVNVYAAGGEEPTPRLDFNIPLMNPDNDSQFLGDGSHQLQLWIEDVEGAGGIVTSREDGTGDTRAVEPASEPSASYPELPVSSEVVEFSVDKGAPTITLDSPPSSFVTNTDFDIAGEATDGLGIDKVEISFDDGTTYQDLPFSFVDNGDGLVTVSFSESVQLGSGSGEMEDGAYDIRVRVRDLSESEATESIAATIDTVAPTVGTINNPAADSWIGGSSATVQGEAGDELSGVAEVRVWVGTQGQTPPPDLGDWTLATGTNNWNSGVNLGDLGEGRKTIHVRARDAAGNWNDTETRDFGVDQNAPSVTETTLGAASVGRNTEFEIGGEISDSNELTSLTVEQQKGGGEWVTVYSNAALTGTGELWDVVALPRDPDAADPTDAAALDVSDGVYDYRITVEDIAGRSATVERTIRLDLVGPEATITRPMQDDSVQGAALLADGTATDVASVSEIEQVRYWLGAEGVNPPGAADPDNIDYTQVESVWTEADGGSSWSAPLDFESLLGVGEEGNLTLHVIAQDTAGNWGENDAGAGLEAIATVDFVLDQNPPTITDVELDETAFGTSTRYRNADYSFGFNANDSNELDNYTVRRNGTALAEHDGEAISGTSRNITVSEDVGGLADGSYEYEVIVTDSAGKETSITRTVVLDTDVPDVSIGDPSPGEIISSAGYTIRGTATDNGGKGIETFEYSTDSTDGTDGTWTAISRAFNWSVSDVDFTSGGEGARTLWVRASDGLNDPTVESVDFFYDTAEPQLSETAIGTEQQLITNEAVTFSGTASDTNELARLEVSVNGAAAEPVTVDETDDSWSYTVSNSDNDGDYVLEFTAVDAAERTTGLTRQVLMDTTTPEASIADLASAYYTDSLPASGSAADVGDTVSGIELVEYQVQPGSDPFNEAGTWTAVTGTDSWFTTIDIGSTGADLSEGEHTLYVRSTDRAGNEMTSTLIDDRARTFTIDREDPSITGLNLESGNEYRSANFDIEFTLGDTLELANYSVSRNGTVLPGFDAEPVSGTSQAITVSEDISGLADGSYEYEVSVTDSVGRSSSESRTVVVDTAGPTFADINLTDGQLISQGEYTVSGTADDAAGSGVDTIEYRVNEGAGFSAWAEASGTTDWTVVLGDLGEGSDQALELRSTDRAGNRQVISRTFDVDFSDPVLSETDSGYSDDFVYSDQAVVFGGEAGDTNELDRLEVQVNGGVAEEIPVANDNTWTYEVTEDGDYWVEFTAYDTVGRSDRLERRFFVDTVDPNVPTIESFPDYVSAELTAEGTADDTGGVDASGLSQVEYQIGLAGAAVDTDGAWTEMNSVSSWRTSIDLSDAGVYPEGTHAFYVRAEDYAGNYSAAAQQDFVIDRGAPTLTETALASESRYVTDPAGFSMNGVIEDTLAIDRLLIEQRYNGGSWVTISDDSSYSGTTSAWSLADLPRNPSDTPAQTAENGLYEYRITVYDSVQRTSQVSREVSYDTQAPTVEYINPVDADTVYDEVTIKGASSDNDQVSEVLYWIGAAGDTPPTDNAQWNSMSGQYSWEDNWDTIAWQTAEQANLDPADYTVHVKAQDAAGNWSTTGTVTVTVDQEANRPIIEVTNIEHDASIDTNLLESNPRIYGVVEDAERVDRNSIQIRFYDDAAAAWGAWQNVSDRPASDRVNASWSHSISGLDDDRYRFQVRAADTTSNVDPSAASWDSGDFSWGWLDSAGSNQYTTDSPLNADGVPVTIDRTSPSVTLADLSSGDYYNAGFVIEGTASDPNGIDVLEINVGNGWVTTDDAGFDYDSATDEWSYSFAVNPDGSDDGSYDLSIRAEDIFGKSTQTDSFFNVDASSPSVDFNRPSNGETVYSDMTISGTSDDSNRIELVELIVGGADQNGDPTPAEADFVLYSEADGTGSPYNWSEETDSGLYGNTDYGVEWNTETDQPENGTDIWRVRLLVRATDRAGNTGEEEIFVYIDQDLDKPTVNFLSPSAGSNLAGSANIAGTGFDESPGLDAIEMQLIAVRNDGTEIGYLDLDGNASGSSVWFPVWEDATGDSPSSISWSQEINSSGELYDVTADGGAYFATNPGEHDGRIRIRVRASDAGVATGNPVERTIRFDDTIPAINNVRIDGSTETRYVRGTFSIDADVVDDERIDRVQISYDGGSSYQTLYDIDVDGALSPQYEYPLSLSIDSESDPGMPGSGIGGVPVRIRVRDNANYQSFYNVTINVDNVAPSGTYGFYDGDFFSGATASNDPMNLYNPDGGATEVVGTAENPAPLRGDIVEAEIYFVRGGDIYNPDGTNDSIAAQTDDFDNGEIGVAYTTDPDYKISIDRDHRFDIDGKELQRPSTETFQWVSEFNSRSIPDGPVDIHYVIHDRAGNRSHFSEPGFIKNNPPVIDGITVGSDLNYSGSVEPEYRFALDQLDPDTYSTFNARERIYVEPQISDGNGSSTIEVFEADGSGVPVGGAAITGASGEIDISGFADGDQNFLIRITDEAGIVIEQPITANINQTDTIAPEVAITELPTTTANDGHIEGTSPYNAGRPSVSGQVTVSGTAGDDQRIRELRLTVPGIGTDVLAAEWDTGVDDLTTQLAGFSIDSSNLSESDGHDVEWSYTWNTAGHPDVAALGAAFGVSVQDFRDGTPAAVGASQVYDIVPYITDIVGELEAGTRSFLRRSATGGYPVRRGQTITVEGFNLGTDVNVDGTVSGTPTSESFDYSIGGAAQSGALVVTRNGIDTINNLVDNTEPELYRPGINDDRYLFVWGNTADAGLSGRTEVVMGRDAAGTGYDWMTAENAQNVYINDTRLTNSWTLRGGWYDRNDDGTLMYAFLHDMNWQSGTDTYQYHGSVQFGLGDVDQGPAYNWQNENTNRLGVGNLSFDDDPNWPGYTGKVMSRYENLRLEASGSDQETDVFVMYFDRSAESRSIVYYTFKVGTNLGTATTTMANGWESDLTKEAERTGDYSVFNGTNVGLRTPENRRELTSGAADSAHFDFTYENGTVYVVYYDESSSQFNLIYNTTPVTGQTNWSAPIQLDTAAGLYPSIEVDPDGGIHVGYYDTAQSNLRYVYLSDYNDTGFAPVDVDALFTNGQYNSLAIRDFGTGDYRPVITSYSLSYSGTPYSLRLSYPLSGPAAQEDGTDISSGDYTGNWETVTVMAEMAPGDSNTFTFVEPDGNVTVGYSGAYVEQSRLYGLKE